MVVFQCAKEFDSLGILSRLASHDAEEGILILPGLCIADIFTHMFFFVIALNFKPSFERRANRDGKKNAYKHFLIRYLSILGFGGVMTSIEHTAKEYNDIVTFLMFVLSVVAVFALIFNFVFLILKKDKPRNIAIKVMTTSTVILGIFNIIVAIIYTYRLFSGISVYKIWGVLQSIGSAGLVALLLVESNALVKGAASIALFVAYAYFHDIPGNMELLDVDVQGGVIATLAWGSILLFYMVLADLFYIDRKAKKEGKKGIFANTFLLSTLVLFLPAIYAANKMILNKGSVSPGFILVCLPIGPIVFFLFSLLDNWMPRFNLFLWWGYSPILMFLLQYLTQSTYLYFLNSESWPFFPALLYTIGVNVLISWIGYKLYSKKRVVKI